MSHCEKKTGDRSTRAQEIALANNRLQRLQNYATQCQALGGGTDLMLTE